jgi:translation initiation factor IF-2
MERKQTIRINDLARELEIKSRAILDALAIVGVAEGKTHSSSMSLAEADKVRQYFQSRKKERAGAAVPSSSAARSVIDLSHLSKPSDVLRALSEAREKQPVSQKEPSRARFIPGQPIYQRSISPPTAGSRADGSRTIQSSRRLIEPQLGTRPSYKVEDTTEKGISADALPEQRTAYTSAMKEAEQALKAMRMQEKNGRSEDDEFGK